MGVSGGIDSSVILTLCVQELGKENVYGLLLPEEESALPVRFWERRSVKALACRMKKCLSLQS
ncbi:hypothetical protein [Methanosarcina barkeri]|uniref:hypothetical protein n=1 Tax=Methanosarcina barkeri TaxID=2208 RepID=UPI00373FCF21